MLKLYILFINFTRLKMKKNSFSCSGFTLMELLISIGFLICFSAILFIVLNPLEQYYKTNDIVLISTANDFINATKYHFISEQTLPWKTDPDCKNELAKGLTLYDIPHCVKDLADSSTLKSNYIKDSNTSLIYVSSCSDSIAVCYKLKSKVLRRNANQVYSKNGALVPNCKNEKTSECYSCSFSTNEGQTCFQTLSSK